MTALPSGKLEVRCWKCPAEDCEWVTLAWLACSLHMEERHPVEAAAGLEPEEGEMWVEIGGTLELQASTDPSPGT